MTGPLRLSLWCVFALAIVSACARADEPTPASPDAGPKVVRIGYFANVSHAQAVLAMDAGDFARALAPAKVEARVFNAGPSLVEALFAREIDVGYVGPSPAINGFLKSRGKGIRIIAGAAADGVAIVARPGSGIRTLEDLRGKQIATPQLGNTQDVSARHYLIQVLGQPDASNVVPVPNAEQASMMARGRIEAAWAVEPWVARLKAELGANIIAEEKDLWPDKTFALTVVVASPEFLAAYPGATERLLGVHAEWTERLQRDPAGLAPALALGIERITGKKLATSIMADALSRVRFTTRPHAASMETFARWAVELGMAQAVPKIEALIDTTAMDSVRPHAPAAPASLAEPR